MAGNNGGNPVTYFGRQVRKERVARGWSIHELARRMGVAAGHLSRIENGKRPPTETIAAKCDDVFPERRGWFTEYYEESRTWTPPGFRDWPEYEDKAISLRAWMPGIVHGLLQTKGYARALLETSPGVTDEMVTARLAARMERQRRGNATVRVKTFQEVGPVVMEALVSLLAQEPWAAAEHAAMADRAFSIGTVQHAPGYPRHLGNAMERASGGASSRARDPTRPGHGRGRPRQGRPGDDLLKTPAQRRPAGPPRRAALQAAPRQRSRPAT